MERHIKTRVGLIFIAFIFGLVLIGSNVALAVQDQNDVVITNFHVYNSEISEFFGKLFSGELFSISATPNVAKAGDMLKYTFIVSSDKAKCTSSNLYSIRWALKNTAGTEVETHVYMLPSGTICDKNSYRSFSGTASYALDRNIPLGTYHIATQLYDASGHNVILAETDSLGQLQVTSSGGGTVTCPTTCSNWGACTLLYGSHYEQSRNCWILTQTTNQCEYHGQSQTCNNPKPTCIAEGASCSGVSGSLSCCSVSGKNILCMDSVCKNMPYITCTHCDGSTYATYQTTCPDENCGGCTPACQDGYECQAGSCVLTIQTIPCVDCDGSSYDFEGTTCPTEAEMNCGGGEGGQNATLLTCKYCNDSTFKTPAATCPDLKCDGGTTPFDFLKWINDNLALFVGIVITIAISIAVIAGLLVGKGKGRRR